MNKDEVLDLVLDWLVCYKDKSMSRNNAEELAEELITAIKQVLAKDALYKLAEESCTSGLRLDDWDKIGCVNHDCDKCKAVQEPVAWLDPEGDEYCNVITASWKRKMQAMSTRLEHEHAEKHTVPVYTTPPAAQPTTEESSAVKPAAPVQETEVSWSVDWGRVGDKSCAMIIKRLPDGKIEVVAVECEP
jgi:hypothetical protein